MKGLIFVELMGFLEEALGAAAQEDIVSDAALPNDAAFTVIGTYPTDYAIALVAQAAHRTGICPDAICRDFGRYLYNRFQTIFPDIMSRYGTARDLLAHVEAHIHEEVRKIYPDARPPLVTTRDAGAEYYVEYESHRPLAHVAFGLVEQCIAAYQEASVAEWVPESTATRATFVIRPRNRGGCA